MLENEVQRLNTPFALASFISEQVKIHMLFLHLFCATPLRCSKWFYTFSFTTGAKVRGFCKDKSNVKVFEYVNVYGNIYNSKIHHNNFGVYSYGEII